jgi:hypothetical protein
VCGFSVDEGSGGGEGGVERAGEGEDGCELHFERAGIAFFEGVWILSDSMKRMIEDIQIKLRDGQTPIYILLRSRDRINTSVDLLQPSPKPRGLVLIREAPREPSIRYSGVYALVNLNENYAAATAISSPIPQIPIQCGKSQRQKTINSIGVLVEVKENLDLTMSALGSIFLNLESSDPSSKGGGPGRSTEQANALR